MCRAFLSASGCWLGGAAGRLLRGVRRSWKMQYFYDHERETLVAQRSAISRSARRGIAVGSIESDKGSASPCVVTSDGGAHWALVPLKEAPRLPLLAGRLPWAGW